MDTCVHCGFCLPTCPSYLLTGLEMDSPRGRIYLMRSGAENRVGLTAATVAHFDTCLGCMACETACPSGVRYAPLIEATRAAIARHHRRRPVERWLRRLIFALLPYPRRLRLLALPSAVLAAVRGSRALLSMVPESLRSIIRLAPHVPLSRLARETPERTPAEGYPRLRAGLVTGCVQRAFFGHVNQATARVLAAEGCEVLAPRNQGCCGALALHAGETDDARRCARGLIESFDAAGVDVIVANAAGCGSAMKEYGALLQDDPVWYERGRLFSAKVRDVSQVLTSFDGPRAARQPMHLKVAYHDACHLGHAQRVRREPRQLVESIPGVTLVPLAEGDICCGSAGIFNLVQPAMAADLGRRKAACIVDTAPDLVVTSNPGCILQLRAALTEKGHAIPVLHLVELLDASIAGRPLQRPEPPGH
jgi:glycolate oxidase iron-sulfur subunit